MSDIVDDTSEPAEEHLKRPLRFGLSFKLLILTILFVMLAEIFVFVPSIANFQKYEIEYRLKTAAVAAHTLTTYPEAALPADMQSDILNQLDAYAVAIRKDGMKQLVAMAEMPPTVTREIDVSSMAFDALFRSALDTLVFGTNRTIRAIGPDGNGGQIELAFSEKGLREQLLGFAGRIFVMSILISAFTAVLVYVSIRHLLVLPMKRLGIQVYRWSQAPESTEFMVRPSGRTDELGRAEIAVAGMQRRVQDLLKQQRRLAELGLAVSKINHDLRNLLASAQLVSDRLTAIPDPTVQRFAPKLVSALDRAINYCQTVLAYGKAQEAPPARRLISLVRLVSDVADVAGLRGNASIEWVNAVPETLEVDADSDQLYRVLLNLVRNSVQALEQCNEPSVVRRVTVSAERVGAVVRITVADTGPGLPEKAREGLFKPFLGSVRRGGTGLGLAIAAELVKAHGGSITAPEGGPGATFEIEIPDRPAELAQVRRSRTG